jgi:hypothetical protein
LHAIIVFRRNTVQDAKLSERASGVRKSVDRGRLSLVYGLQTTFDGPIVALPLRAKTTP